MDIEEGLSTHEKAILRDRDTREEFSASSSYGEKVHLSRKKTLNCLYYPGTKPILLLDFHGGGFCFKGPLDNDAYCHFLNERYGFSILDFDFTSSAYKAYPTQLLEMRLEYRAFRKHNPNLQGYRLFLVGHSSGANLAAAFTELLLKDGTQADGLLLDYPYLDLTREPSTRPIIPETFPDFLLNDWNYMYCPYKELRDSPLVSPLKMSKKEASFFPPTYIVTSERDRLHDDGLLFSQLLASAGVPVFHFRADERHGFIERHMRNVYMTPDDPAVLYAKKITEQSYAWLLNNLKK